MSDLRALLVRATLDEEFRELMRRDLDRAFEGYELESEDEAVLRRGDHGLLALIGKVLAEEITVREAPELPDTAPESAAPSVQLPDLKFDVTLSPTQIGDVLTYRASIEHAPTRPSAGGPAPSRAAPPTDPQWGHRLGSAAAHEAADAVRKAPEGERSSALLALIAALKDPDAEETRPAPDLPDGEPDLRVVGLGIKNYDHLTVETDRALRRARQVLYLDTGLATRELLEERCDDVVPLYAESYAERGSRLNAYHHVAARVLSAALVGGPIVFAIQGHPSVFCYPPILMRDLARMLGIPFEILPGISAMDCLFAELGIDPAVHGVQMYEATDLLLRCRPLAPDVPTLIWQAGTVETRLHSRRVSSEGRFDRLKAWLSRFYPLDHPITAFFSAPHPLVPSTRFDFALGDIGSHAAALHPGITLYLPPVAARPLVDLELLKKLDSPAHLAAITRG